MKPKVSIITLGVSDFATSLRFYREGLGFPTDKYNDGDGIAFFRLEGSWLAIYPLDKLAEDARASSAGSGFRGVTLSHNVKTREEVDQVVQLAVAAGAKLMKQPQSASWGGYSGYFADPDGHAWEVAYNPFTHLT
ncbi:MAG TPA: VOC family protein [Candidatus Binataceae bacterium]|nr:VOC family protein [Candidatus Binataceae bacterium]